MIKNSKFKIQNSKILEIVFFSLILFTMPVLAHAQDSLLDKVTGGLKIAGRAAKVETGDKNRDIVLFIGKIFEQVLIFVGVLFFVFVVIGGIMWMTSGGSEEQIEKGKKMLRSAVIGFGVTVAAFLITNFVMAILFRASDPSFIGY